MKPEFPLGVHDRLQDAFIRNLPPAQGARCTCVDSPEHYICSKCNRPWPCPPYIFPLALAASVTVASDWLDSLNVLADAVLEEGIFARFICRTARSRQRGVRAHRFFLKHVFLWAQAVTGFKPGYSPASKDPVRSLREWSE